MVMNNKNDINTYKKTDDTTLIDWRYIFKEFEPEHIKSKAFQLLEVSDIRSNLDSKKPMIALTFDDGPGPYTTKILDLLKKYDVHATFFVVGNNIKKNSEIVARTANEGHDILGHSWDHKDLIKLTEKEIQTQILATHTAIEDITGMSTKMFRPPYGSANKKVRHVAKQLGFMMVNWSIDPKDWEHRDADMTHAAIMDHAKDGGIVLLHDIHASTARAMKNVIPDLVDKGYQLVSISELFFHRNIPITPGKVIYSANLKTRHEGVSTFIS